MAALSEGDAVAVGGATAVTLLIKEGLISPSRLVWLGRLPGWREIDEGDGVVRIGAGATLGDVARSPLVGRVCPALAAAAGVAANPRVRAVATLGGHLAHADPRQDLPPVLLAAAAVAVVTGPGGERRIPVDELLVGLYETALGESDVLTRVEVPVEAGTSQVYARFNPGSAEDYPTVGVAVQLQLDGAGTVGSARLAAGGCSGRAVLFEAAAALVRGRHASEVDLGAVGEAVAGEIPVVGDHRGSEAYKRRVAGIWAGRAVSTALHGGAPLLGRQAEPSV